MPTQSHSYDDVTYPALPYLNTHPSRLATMALLHGLQPAPVEHCRVLEVGCNAGANLIPMAYGLPRSEFVGLDYAALPIARGQERIKALGLSNIRLLQLDLMDAADASELGGHYNYIIAHGLYSWVPAPVRDRLLALCGERLAPNGVAFISYSALPGGYMRLLVRDILQHRHKHEVSTLSEVSDSLGLLRLISESRPADDGMRVLLERELESAERRGPAVVFHDEMSSVYEPVMFKQFATHASQHGLQFLSEAEIPGPVDPSFQMEIVTRLQELSSGDPIEKEQLLDFARMRMYRESLLCRAEAPITQDLQVDSLQHFWLSSAAEVLPGRVSTSRVFSLPGGIRVESEHPVMLALMQHLIASFPAPVHASMLVAVLEESGMPLNAEMLTLILRLVVSRMVQLDAWRPPVLSQLPDRPMASLVCRMEAVEAPHMTTLLHTALATEDPICRQLVLLLDGTRDRSELLTDLAAALPDVRRDTLAEGLDATLNLLTRAGVIVDRTRVH